MEYLAALLPIAVIAASVYFSIRSFRRTGSAVKAVRVNLIAAALMFVVCLASPLVVSATGLDDAQQPADAVVLADETGAQPVAEEEAETTTASAVDPTKGLGMIGAALVTGMSGIGGGIAVAAAAPAAIGATSEDPKAFGKALIFVALGESIALYGLVISIMILGKY
ncbi:MAG: hypothetical protein IJP17_06635 [Clostridia bacterium]|nr:hypothetical protein [Clostridia bacterium]